MKIFVLLIICLKLISLKKCANILVLIGVPSPSHYIWIKPVINRLAEGGHNVTVLSVNVDTKPPNNVAYIHLEETYSVLYGNGTTSNNIMERSQDNPFQAALSAYKFATLGCIGATSSTGFQILMNYPDDFIFDLVIYDFTCGPCLLGFMPKFSYPPLISVSAFSIPQFSHLLVGGHKPTSYVPHFALLYDTRMTFFQRTANFLVQHFDFLYRRLVFLPRIQQMAQAAFNRELPDLARIEERTQLMLVNSNPALDPAETLPQNVIPVGGLQIAQAQPLSKEIEDFIKCSRKGTVLFAMGTNFKSNMFSRTRQNQFIEAFARLPEYNFLWKFDGENLPIQAPPNLMVRPWLPQNDILAHPQVKAFITHCGLLSTHEAMYHGVPIVGLPIYVDQHRNAQRLVQAGVGVTLNLQTLSNVTIKEALLMALEGQTFRRNMRKRSELLRDQPQQPLDRAIWWIEWVLRHPHATHLRSPMLDLNSFAKDNFDVVVFLMSTILTFLYLVSKCAKIFSKKYQSIRFYECKNKKYS